jgi:diadenosine tetraphosphatase ApaH/serine/threonine PP2A family protein phosphatase
VLESEILGCFWICVAIKVKLGLWALQVRTIERVCEIPHEGPFCDLMWSDPEDIETWAVSPRGAGWLFGGKVTAEFNNINGLDLICRAHQLVQEGLKYMFMGACHINGSTC